MRLNGWLLCLEAKKMKNKNYNLNINGIATSITVLPAHHWPARLKGLLGTLSLDKNSSLWLKPCNSIHTMGMLYSIDVLFLDDKNTVKKIAENVKPFRFRWSSKYVSSVVEFTAGTVKKIGINPGDILDFESP